MKAFSNKIINWYKGNKRMLPWRKTKDPYLIWLSEIILQQTRVEQGMPYYFKFSEAYPNIKALANAKENAVMKLWQGLGYYSRARNLHATAKIIRDEYHGAFPKTYEEIKQLKGVGDYTAAAISSFAYNLPHAVVDGNVFRLLARYFGVDTPIDSSKGKKDFFKLANQLIDKKQAATYNQAIMEFGSLQCKANKPDCDQCPLQSSCYAYAKGKVDALPVKSKKIKQRKRYFHYLVLKHKGAIVLKKRTEKDIWINLHDFPLIESDKAISEKRFLSTDHWKKMVKGKKDVIRSVSKSYKHVLSHQIIHAKFWEIELHQKPKLAENFYLVPEKNLKKYAVPQLIDNYLEDRGS